MHKCSVSLDRDGNGSICAPDISSLNPCISSSGGQPIQALAGTPRCTGAAFGPRHIKVVAVQIWSINEARRNLIGIQSSHDRIWSEYSTLADWIVVKVIAVSFKMAFRQRPCLLDCGVHG